MKKTYPKQWRFWLGVSRSEPRSVLCVHEQANAGRNNAKNARVKGIKGFTLIELLLSLLVVGILLLTTQSLILSLIARNRAKAAEDHLINAITFAKNMAVYYRTTVTLCKSANQQNCSGKWSDGQIVFIDSNKNGVVDIEERILHVFAGTRAKEQLVWKGFVSQDYLSLSPTGINKDANGSFFYCPALEHQQYAWQLVINRVGRMRVVHNIKCT